MKRSDERERWVALINRLYTLNVRMSQMLRSKNNQSRYSWTTDTGKARPEKSQPYFTKNCRYKMKEWGLSERQLIDVLYHGNAVEQNKLVRQYNGYSISIYYGRDRRDGHYMIYSCWKQHRR